MSADPLSLPVHSQQAVKAKLVRPQVQTTTRLLSCDNLTVCLGPEALE